MLERETGVTVLAVDVLVHSLGESGCVGVG